MKELGIVSKQPNKHKYKYKYKYKISEDVSKIAPNLLSRKFNVKAPNQVWCGDVTYVLAGNKWLYLAVVMDLFARRIVGYSVCPFRKIKNSLNKELKKWVVIS